MKGLYCFSIYAALAVACQQSLTPDPVATPAVSALQAEALAPLGDAQAAKNQSSLVSLLSSRSAARPISPRPRAMVGVTLTERE